MTQRRRRYDLVQRRITATHEAGHACSAVALGLGFTSVDIIRDEGGYGMIRWTPDLWHALQLGYHTDPTVIHLVRRRLVAVFTGDAAQRRVAPWSQWRRDAGSDLVDADNLLQRLIAGPPDYKDPALPYGVPPFDWRENWYTPDRLVPQQTLDEHHLLFRFRAAALVARIWPQIEIVTDELLRCKVLSFDEVRRLMTRRKPISNSLSRHRVVRSIRRNPNFRNPDRTVEVHGAGGRPEMVIVASSSANQKAIRDARATVRRLLRT